MRATRTFETKTHKNPRLYRMKNEDKAWTQYREIFSDIYDNSNYASPLQAYVMRASHKLTERGLNEDVFFEKVIEIGAGTGEHFHHVKHKFSSYTLTDIDPKTLSIASQKITAPQNSSLFFEAQNGSSFDYEDNTFDRLIATHVLEHIYHPHLALKEWSRIVKNDGVLSILIPTDPGLAWRLGRHLGPRRKAIKQGIAYDYVMAREHVNSCNNLIALLRHYFPQRTERWWPMMIPSIDMNLFFLFEAKNIK